MTTDPLEALAARCELMQGPSRALDGRLFMALVASDNVRALTAVALCRPAEEDDDDFYARQADALSVPSYTRNMDAAMRLVPACEPFRLNLYPKQNLVLAEIFLHADSERGNRHVTGRSALATQSLATCAAAARAHALKGDDHG